ncbi:MAG: chromate efflux transporter [Planctomycetota bacterium]|nr:MAG: chromate efflux transporter [Planctomycetota bacterium]
MRRTARRTASKPEPRHGRLACPKLGCGAERLHPPSAPSFRAALRFWWKLGWISFGGPSGQIAILHREVVERKRWLDEDAFLRGLSFCTLLPGPEAQQLATYVGWRLHGTLGGVAAGALFVLPGAAVLVALSWLSVLGRDVGWVGALFDGLRPAVIALVAGALWRIGSRALRTRALWAVALAAFALQLAQLASFPWLVFGALALGALLSRARPAWFGKPAHAAAAAASATSARAAPRPLAVLGACLALWWAPVGALAWWLGARSLHVALALFFSQAAVVTFGGAYAVLPYVAEHAVASGWLAPGEMMHGLALAETTPGPLILVIQHVGFVGGWNLPGELSRESAALLGAAISTWVTFVPCFLLILLGAPHVERLGSRPAIAAALAAVTAVNVAVIASLLVWFARAALWQRELGRGIDAHVDWIALAIAALALLALQRRWCEAPLLVAACALLGLARHALTA